MTASPTTTDTGTVPASTPVTAVIGSGRMGDALVRLLAPHRRGLIWSGRDPQRLTARVAELGHTGVVDTADHTTAVHRADLLVLALWHRHALDFVRTHA
ncbi:NAD(P)-binding domain-containing protein [Streptomyces sp. NPDC020996]|uniref:NAD(P)-binding domain-containing protein n=1 Tax=Streptomyces sp. NPDC020996 TaxID=3154791 RepID=UPI0033E6F2E6